MVRRMKFLISLCLITLSLPSFAETPEEFLKAARAQLKNPKTHATDLDRIIENVGILLIKDRCDLLMGPKEFGESKIVLNARQALGFYEKIVSHPRADDEILKKIALKLESIESRHIKNQDEKNSEQLYRIVKTLVDRTLQAFKLSQAIGTKEPSATAHIIGAIGELKNLPSEQRAELMKEMIPINHTNVLSQGFIVLALTTRNFTDAAKAEILKLLLDHLEKENTYPSPSLNLILRDAQVSLPDEEAIVDRMIGLSLKNAEPRKWQLFFEDLKHAMDVRNKKVPLAGAEKFITIIAAFTPPSEQQ